MPKQPAKLIFFRLLSKSILEQEAGVDVECAVAVLVLDEFVFAEFAYRQAVLKGYDKVLVHDRKAWLDHRQFPLLSVTFLKISFPPFL